MNKIAVDHWKRMRDDAPGAFATNGEAPIGTYCPYCQEHNSGPPEKCDNCEGCPIFERTGQTGCTGTPYHEANEAWCDYKDSGWNESLREWWQLKADAEINFLESL